jgi:hypothetical protein
MDLKDQLKQLGERIVKLKDKIETEEATKNAFIMPFIQHLGYDVFNPLEFVPEFTCDIGTKKGEKIDYAIIKDGEPVILIECKHWGQDLSLHDNQLIRYFNVSKAKFGIITNGIVYRFYTDLVEKNKMDITPFFEFDLTNIKEHQINELKKFHKSNFDIEQILSTAADLKYMTEIKNILKTELVNPSEQFIKIIAKQAYDGLLTSKYVDYFGKIIKESFQSLINDTFNDRLKSALKAEAEKEEKEVQEKELLILDKNEIETTNEELEGFYTIRTMLKDHVIPERLSYSDFKSYLSIILDGSSRKAVCRLYFNSKQKYISTFDKDRKEQKNAINAIFDVFNYKDTLIETINQLES